MKWHHPDPAKRLREPVQTLLLVAGLPAPVSYFSVYQRNRQWSSRYSGCARLSGNAHDRKRHAIELCSPSALS